MGAAARDKVMAMVLMPSEEEEEDPVAAMGECGGARLWCVLCL